LNLAVTTQGAGEQTTVCLLHQVVFMRKPTFKPVVMGTAQVQNFHGKDCQRMPLSVP
jgi:hypothetical protein